MRDEDCIIFLQWCLPRLGLRWAGYRKVRRQVCKRIARRIAALGIADVGEYRRRLDTCPEEWSKVESYCRITISRFYRDRRVFARLTEQVLPALAHNALQRGAGEVRSWSAGCASGEEVYSLKFAWEFGAAGNVPGVSPSILATDADPVMLARAVRGRYRAGSLKELPEDWRRHGFEPREEGYLVRPRFRDHVTFVHQDIRRELPAGLFDLILCRNLVFTYFAEPVQDRIAGELAPRLRRGGTLLVGAHEAIGDPHHHMLRLGCLGFYRKQ